MPEPDPVPLSPASSLKTGAPGGVTDHDLVRLIGRGSYGEVWLARNSLGTYRAVKVVYEKTFRHRRPFEREFNGVQKFEPVSRLHEGLVDILQVGKNDAAGCFYCVMELADDVRSGPIIDPECYTPRTLAYDLGQQQRLPLAECQRIGVAIASALDFLHRRGLIHRDVKPSNIVFVNGTPRLADIGLVAEMSEAKSYVGTEGFIPPEGPGTIQSDIYSLGKVLYEISTGKDRHEYPDLPTQLGDPAEKRELSELNRIVLKACRADPGQRYKTAEAMRADLAALEDGHALLDRRNSRRRLRRAITAAAGMAGLSLLAVLLRPRTPEVNSKPAPAKFTTTGSSGTNMSATVLAPEGLVGWWRGEENGSDGAGNNPIARLDGVGFGPGKVGQGFSFDGQAHRVIVSNAPALNIGPGEDFSIEAWIQPLVADTDYGFMSIVGKGWSPRETEFLGYSLALSHGKLILTISDRLDSFAFANFGDSGPDLRDGRFHHVAATVQRDSRRGGKLYVDGKPIFAFDPTSHRGDLSTTNALHLGHGFTPDFNTFFKGTIDEASLYRRALSQEEIQSIYAAGSAGKHNPKISSTSFEPRVDLACEGGPQQFAVADFDGDGKADFAVAAAYGHKLCVYRNLSVPGSLGVDSFDLPFKIPLGAGVQDPNAIAAADLDDDGKMDLVASERQRNHVVVYKNISSIGRLAFAPPIYLATDRDPVKAIIHDLDGDGRRDLITANESGGTISILRNVGGRGTITAESFAHRIDLTAGARSRGLDVGDFDGDGKPDLAVANIGETYLSIFRNTTAPDAFDANSFAPRVDLPALTNTVDLAVGDVDRDGKPDLVLGAGNNSRTFSVIRNLSGPGPLSTDSFAARVDFPVGSWVNDLALGDLDGDRRLDVVVVTQIPISGMTVYQNLSTPGVFTADSMGPRLDFSAAQNAVGIALADLDGDGALEAIFGNVYSSSVSVYRNRHSSTHRP